MKIVDDGSDDSTVVCEKRDSRNTVFTVLGNIYSSDSDRGSLLYSKTSSRNGKLNLAEAIMKGVEDADGDRIICSGGVLILA